MSEQPRPNCKAVRLGAVGALLECIEGRDEQAAELLAMLNGAELQAVENGAVALSLHASRARGGGEAPAEGWRAAYDKLAAEAVALRERAKEAEEHAAYLDEDIITPERALHEKTIKRAEQAEAAIQRVRDLHARDDSSPHGPWCGVCTAPWPCRTRLAAELDEPKETP